jgi:hypothetical protein
VRVNSIYAVIPRSIDAAASAGGTLSGKATARHAGNSRVDAYPYLPGIGHLLADRETCDTFAQSFNHAGAFNPQDRWCGQRINPVRW